LESGIVDQKPSPRIISAERSHGDLLITFDDDTCALYSAALLYSALPRAEPVPDADPD